ncbi:putative NAD dependent epimerase/dehydratase [Plenodomus tracheiphilus IPT5]|uniref:Putative NAD dependent epimerase/dehydratase n=1 Tax=Plenodomus tracheiphilus IPT5 TaxID=1408161 RepID=A0A6A7B3Q3_9PLEO|nr:putative NAD dependent epimerase/dehydratase [Plenodomus tracheiphilus IPT5]
MSKGIVLISGVNGYIAAVAAKHFLDHGYSVRGTVRKATSAEKLIHGPLKSYVDAGKFSIVEVPDITIDGAFDEAVKGITHIAHLASPVSFGFKDPVPIIHAAVRGTETILNSALAHSGPQLKSVVTMSSIASIKGAHPAPHTFTEKDWNDFAEAMCEKRGTKTPGPVIYSASKAAGERTFWKWRDEHKPKFTMAALNPVMVIGPALIPPNSPESVAESYQLIYEVYAGASNLKPMFMLPQVVDVRDVAQLLRAIIEKPEQTNGERYIASSAVGHPQAIADILREELKDEAALKRIKPGKKGKGYAADYQSIEGQGGFVVDGSKATKLLEGGKYINYRKSVVDTVGMFEGWFREGRGKARL